MFPDHYATIQDTLFVVYAGVRYIYGLSGSGARLQDGNHGHSYMSAVWSIDLIREVVLNQLPGSVYYAAMKPIPYACYIHSCILMHQTGRSLCFGFPEIPYFFRHFCIFVKTKKTVLL